MSLSNIKNTFKRWLSKKTFPVLCDQSLEAFINCGRSWQETLAASKWLGVHWPVEYGGRGLTLAEEAIIQEELGKAGSPQILGLFGLTMVGPVLIKYGTAEQKQKFLQNILFGKTTWCQGFSEPGAGSDLANLSTKAVPVDGGYKVTGQKAWTSFAHIADWCFLLIRSGENTKNNPPKKHEGLTYLLVDMKSPGITVRPLKQISGDDEFNEVFFDDVFVPIENIVGAPGDGWKIALSTLMYERVVLTFARHVQSDKLLKEIENVIKQNKIRNQIFTKKLLDLKAKAFAMRSLAEKHLNEYSKGIEPGPESSLDKLFWSETFQEIAILARDIGEQVGGTFHQEAWHQYLYSRGRTIAAGTSEVQRNVIAERVLGLGRA